MLRGRRAARRAATPAELRRRSSAALQARLAAGADRPPGRGRGGRRPAVSRSGRCTSCRSGSIGRSHDRDPESDPANERSRYPPSPWPGFTSPRRSITSTTPPTSATPTPRSPPTPWPAGTGLLGDDVFFLTGTDEHGLKVQRAAEANGLTPQEQADQTSARYRETWAELDISYDDFIRTSEPRHHQATQALMQAAYDNGWIELRPYEGLYCVSCEAYYTESELLDGTRCPIHGTPVELLSEENYFFKLSEFTDRLLEWYETHPGGGHSRGQAQRGHRLDQGRPARHLHLAHVDHLGRARSRGTRPTSSTSGTTPSSTTPPPSATGPIPERFDGLVAGGAPPHRQGHPALPLRVLAGAAHGGRHRAARPHRRARVPAGRRREDVQVVAHRDRARRSDARPSGSTASATTSCATRPSGRTATSLTRAWSAATTPTWPTTSATCWPGSARWSSASAAGSAPPPTRTAPWPRSRPSVYETAAGAWARIAPSEALEATWRLVRETNAALEAAEPWKAEPGPAVDAVLGDALEALRIVAILASPALTRAVAGDLAPHRAARPGRGSAAARGSQPGAAIRAGCRSSGARLSSPGSPTK